MNTHIHTHIIHSLYKCGGINDIITLWYKQQIKLDVGRLIFSFIGDRTNKFHTNVYVVCSLWRSRSCRLSVTQQGGNTDDWPAGWQQTYLRRFIQFVNMFRFLPNGWTIIYWGYCLTDTFIFLSFALISFLFLAEPFVAVMSWATAK